MYNLHVLQSSLYLLPSQSVLWYSMQSTHTYTDSAKIWHMTQSNIPYQVKLQWSELPCLLSSLQMTMIANWVVVSSDRENCSKFWSSALGVVHWESELLQGWQHSVASCKLVQLWTPCVLIETSQHVPIVALGPWHAQTVRHHMNGAVRCEFTQA